MNEGIAVTQSKSRPYPQIIVVLQAIESFYMNH